MSKIIKLLNMNCPSLVVTKSAIAVLINPLSAIDFTVLRKKQVEILDFKQRNSAKL